MMGIQWRELPSEIRNMIYREFYQSLTVALHPKLENWEYSDSEASDTDDTDIESDTNDDQAASAPQELDTNSDVVEPTQQDFASLLLTCKSVRKEAEPFLFSELSFIIDNYIGHYIDGTDFAIDSRIRNLEIVQEPRGELWGCTITFLERHFRQPSPELICLTLSGEVFDLDVDEENLAKVLKTTLPRVSRLSFMLLLGGNTVVEDVTTNTRIIRHSTRYCAVTVMNGTAVTLQAADQSVCDEAEEELRNAYDFSNGATFEPVIISD